MMMSWPDMMDRSICCCVCQQQRKDHKGDLSVVANIARAHHNLDQRNTLVIALLSIIEAQLSPLLGEFSASLRNLSELNGKEYASVALKTRQLLMRQKLPSPQQRRIAIRAILDTITPTHTEAERLARLTPLIDQSQPIEDLIFSFFFDAKHSTIQNTAMEVYIRRVYQMYTIPNLSVDYVAHVPGSSSVTTATGSTTSLVLSPGGSSGGASPAGGVGGMLVAKFSFYMEEDKEQSGMPAPLGGGTRLQSRIGKSISVADISKLASTKEDDESDDAAAASGVAVAPLSSGGKRSGSVKGAAALAVHNKNLALLSRFGVMAFFKDFDSAKRGFEHAVSANFPNEKQFNEPVHILYIGFRWSQKMPTDEQMSGYFRTFLKGHEKLLEAKGIRRVTFIATLKDGMFSNTSLSLPPASLFALTDCLSLFGPFKQNFRTTSHIVIAWTITRIESCVISSQHSLLTWNCTVSPISIFDLYRPKTAHSTCLQRIRLWPVAQRRVHRKRVNTTVVAISFVCWYDRSNH